MRIITASILKYKSYIQCNMDFRHQKAGGKETPPTGKFSKGKVTFFAKQYVIRRAEGHYTQGTGFMDGDESTVEREVSFITKTRGVMDVR